MKLPQIRLLTVFFVPTYSGMTALPLPPPALLPLQQLDNSTNYVEGQIVRLNPQHQANHFKLWNYL